MQSEQRPVVLYCSDNQTDHDAFRGDFGEDFLIVPCGPGGAAETLLASGLESPAAVIVDCHNVAQNAGEAVFRAVREQYPGALRILFHNEIGLDAMVRLLDSHLITHCFRKPVDTQQIRSRVYAASLGVGQGLAEEASGVPGDRREHAPQKVALIVDDEPAGTRYLKKHLENLGCRCEILCADNAVEARELLNSHRSEVAVIISDQRMPGMTGSQLLNELRATQPAVIRVLTSAWGEVDVAQGALNDGRIFQYLKKPWDAEEVLSCIHSALDEHLRLVEQQARRRSALDDEHESIIRERKQSLRAALTERVGMVPGGPGAVDAFLGCLDRIEVLPPSASSIRASRETDLEQQLVRRICVEFDARFVPVRQGTNLPPGQHLAALDRYLEEGGASQYTADSPVRALTDALDTLLEASGLSPSVLQWTPGPRPLLSLQPGRALRMYQHLCGPLTVISEPLIQQQAALLVLHVETAAMGGCMEITGGKQSCRFSITQGQDHRHV